MLNIFEQRRRYIRVVMWETDGTIRGRRGRYIFISVWKWVYRNPGKGFVGMLLMYTSRFEGRKKWERKRCPAVPDLVRRESRIYITVLRSRPDYIPASEHRKELYLMYEYTAGGVCTNLHPSTPLSGASLIPINIPSYALFSKIYINTSPPPP